MTAKVPTPVSNEDILSKLFKIGVDNNLQKEMAEVNLVIDTLKYNHGISVREHLGFGNAATQHLKFHTTLFGSKFIGELNSNNNLHGKGICINSNGTIWIQYWNNGRVAPGNYIYIFSDGRFDVGEFYLKDGKRRLRCTQYFTDGTTQDFDRAI